MTRSKWVSVALTGCLTALLAVPAQAVSLQVEVVDQSGQPAADTVIYAVPMSTRLPARPPADAIIDQVRRQFVPLVSVVQTGASISFPNKDNIEHDVYSFSPAKKFELKLYHGIPAHPVVFDKPGLVVMGCNIHDMMIAYLLVVDTPYFAKTDAQGHASIAGLPADNYQVTAWSYRALDQDARPAQKLNLGADVSAKFVLQLKPEAM
ncbi:methylamine utilization protein [Paraburkholderia bryophila]|uniref:methylamine utilization protein n=1 Tax=Paraburkholderia bryophila TaxID=420952 RepID=UPI00234A33E9|nr:methylamine utilization protein [Paraburkholderia bryophila]WCM23821.1 methylamine utilization protein [Paraburkholderia bryophila]